MLRFCFSKTLRLSDSWSERRFMSGSWSGSGPVSWDWYSWNILYVGPRLCSGVNAGLILYIGLGRMMLSLGLHLKSKVIVGLVFILCLFWKVFMFLSNCWSESRKWCESGSRALYWSFTTYDWCWSLNQYCCCCWRRNYRMSLWINRV